ncbi:MAG TPA: hypothetical protein VHT73_18435 [Thermodesulfobacteriota bacterium]|nr:hypothetical protein [Thermodesulfobacteriota bacterium]
MNETQLIDRKTLMKKHPALNSRWRIDWLIRTRRIPLVRIGARIYFDESEIIKWIEENKIRAEAR